MLIYIQIAVSLYMCTGRCMYMPVVHTDTRICVLVHGCVYRIMGACVNLCLFLNRCQIQETRKNRK